MRVCNKYPPGAAAVRKSDEILIADFVYWPARPDGIDIPATAAGFLFQAAARRDINFAADDRFHSLILRRLVKVNRSVQDAADRVIASAGNFNSCARSINRSKRHPPIEANGVLGVQMEMNRSRRATYREVTASSGGTGK